MMKTPAALSVKTNKNGNSYAPLSKLTLLEGFNVRKNTEPDEQLLQSIRQKGVYNPIHVCSFKKGNGSLYVIDGARRFSAAKQTDLGSIPVVYHGLLTEKEALIISLTANDNQKKLTKREQFEGFRRLKEQGLDEEEISLIMAVDRRLVAEALKVEKKGSRKLREAAQSDDGGIPTRAAARVASLPKKVQDKIVGKISGKSVDEARQVIQDTEQELGITRPGRKPRIGKPKARPSITDVPDPLTTDVPDPSNNHSASPLKYRLAPNAADRCKAIEDIIRKKLRHNNLHRELKAQLLVIECLKGKLEVDDLFDWNKV